ncbi:hypothetical protein CASFOL_040109 [Castilleja foliolosa]|uniref:Uncharacterized protein n=1 Tax=Castilleja foliolosa TaxID=1961234 RepID=A0ABD3BEI8_9LAMI
MEAQVIELEQSKESLLEEKLSKRLPMELNAGGFGKGVILSCLPRLTEKVVENIEKVEKIDDNIMMKLKKVFNQMTNAVISLWKILGRSNQKSELNNLASAAGNNKVTSEDGDANYRIEDARALVEKLVTESSELVEKLDRRVIVTELYSSAGSILKAVPNQLTDNSSALIPDLTIGVNGVHIADQATDSISEARYMIPISSSTPLENVTAEDRRNGELVKINNDRVSEISSEIVEADDIVQIPLDEDWTKSRIIIWGCLRMTTRLMSLSLMYR